MESDTPGEKSSISEKLEVLNPNQKSHENEDIRVKMADLSLENSQAMMLNENKRPKFVSKPDDNIIVTINREMLRYVHIV